VVWRQETFLNLSYIWMHLD